MGEINHKIVIVGLLCLTIIYLSLVFSNHDNDMMGTLIVGVIGLAIGVVIPSPKVDNRRGVFIW